MKWQLNTEVFLVASLTVPDVATAQLKIPVTELEPHRKVLRADSSDIALTLKSWLGEAVVRWILSNDCLPNSIKPSQHTHRINTQMTKSCTTVIIIYSTPLQSLSIMSNAHNSCTIFILSLLEKPKAVFEHHKCQQ